MAGPVFRRISIRIMLRPAQLLASRPGPTGFPAAETFTSELSPPRSPRDGVGYHYTANWTLAVAGLSPAGRMLLWAATLLGRHYPASSLVRASPSPHPAWPAPRGGPVDGPAPPPLGLPVLRRISCCPHAVVNTPAGPRAGVARHGAWWQPSPFSRRVGPCVACFEALTQQSCHEPQTGKPHSRGKALRISEKCQKAKAHSGIHGRNEENGRQPQAFS